MIFMTEAMIRKKVLACWFGKNIGGTLGGPYEGVPNVNNLTFYDPVPCGSMPNDDLELQAMYAAALARMEKPEISREILADIWLGHMNFHCDEYAVAMRNLALGIRPPWSGSYDNYYINGMGAAIRSELWACLAPGNPALASRFAYEDACIDHAGDGIDAEVFFAVVESLAFVEPDIRTLIDAGLASLPAGSVLAEGIRMTCSLWDSTGDWRMVRDALFERYATEFKTDVRINIPFTVLALLSGGGDFGKTVCDAANCGMDTDCNGATVGSVMGAFRRRDPRHSEPGRHFRKVAASRRTRTCSPQHRYPGFDISADDRGVYGSDSFPAGADPCTGERARGASGAGL